jgi:hypothetical protein
MNKGIVMEMTSSHLVVMTPQGVFEKIPRSGRTCRIGEEILFSFPRQRLKLPPVSSALAAAVILCLVVFAGFSGIVGNHPVVAYVSMDINPSVEMGVDADQQVLELRGLNSDGTQLINDVKYKGEPIGKVTDLLLQQAEEQGYLSKGEADIVIASTLVKSKAKIDDATLAQEVKRQVAEHIQEKHADQAKNYEVTTLVTPVEVRQQAEQSGVSAGKYAIYLAAQNNGHPIPLQQFRQDSIHEIAKENGGIGKLINAGKQVSKDEWKELVKEEKDGKLGKKAEEMAKRNKDGKSGEVKDAKDEGKDNGKGKSGAGKGKDNGLDSRNGNSNGKSNGNSNRNGNSNGISNGNNNGGGHSNGHGNGKNGSKGNVKDVDKSGDKNNGNSQGNSGDGDNPGNGKSNGKPSGTSNGKGNTKNNEPENGKAADRGTKSPAAETNPASPGHIGQDRGSKPQDDKSKNEKKQDDKSEKNGIKQDESKPAGPPSGRDPATKPGQDGKELKDKDNDKLDDNKKQNIDRTNAEKDKKKQEDLQNREDSSQKQDDRV